MPNRREIAILQRFRASLVHELEQAKLRGIRSVFASSQEIRERASWDIDDTAETLQTFDDSPQGRQLREYEADLRGD